MPPTLLPATYPSAHSSGPSHAAAAFHDVLISYFPREVTVEALRAVHEAHTALRAQHPAGTVTLGIVGSGIAMPPRDVRAFAATIGREASSSLRGECIVLQGHPFWVGMARSALRTIELLSASWHPRQVFSDVPSAATWVRERSVAGTLDPDALVDATRSLLATWEATYGSLPPKVRR